MRFSHSFRCKCEYFYPPSLRSSYYGSYLYRPRRYYYSYGSGYGSRWGRPGRDRLSSGLIKRAETFNDNLISNLNYGGDDEGDRSGFIDKYNDDELKFIIQHILKASSGLDKRGFDRLTSGFIRRKRSPVAHNENVGNKVRRKRSTDENKTGPAAGQSENAVVEERDKIQDAEEASKAKPTDEEFFAIQRNKKGFDRLSSSFVKKDNSKIDIGSIGDVMSENVNSGDKKRLAEVEQSDKETSVVSSEINTKPQTIEMDPVIDPNDDIKRHFDRLESAFVKRRGFDRLTSGFVKRRGFDRLTSGFVKRRGFDRLTSGFVKKDNDKRRFDRLTSGFVKKDAQKRRGFDRLTSGFVKKSNDKDHIGDNEAALNNLYEEKRRFDRLTSGFVKKDIDKRYIDRMTSGFVKKNDDKRRFDRLTSGFVKKDDNKRRFDRLTSGFVKKDADKRYFGRLNSGIVKKRDDKRRFDRLTSGFVKKSDGMNEINKLNTDSYGYDEGLEKDIEQMEKYYTDLKGDDIVISNDLGENSNEISDTDMSLLKHDNSNDDDVAENDKRRIDRVAYGFIKRNDETQNFVPVIGAAQSDLQKRYFDRLTSGFVKKDQLQDGYLDKRRLDRLYSGFVKRPYSDIPYIDRIKFKSGNGVENDASDLYSSDSDVSKLLGGYGNEDINMPDAPLNRKKRSIYGNDRGAFPSTGNGFFGGNGYYIDGYDYATEHEVNELQKRRLDRLMSGFVKKGSKFDSNKNLFDNFDNQRQAMPSTDDANYYLL